MENLGKMSKVVFENLVKANGFYHRLEESSAVVIPAKFAVVQVGVDGASGASGTKWSIKGTERQSVALLGSLLK